ncbi:hypothetical protein Poli38472_007962 [Pythium oligandrum]|uniref:Cleavage and polyadenylation specificity factor subunit 1 n=1 Tax=Pythium oligandrum TaxID=41045 RepID=A0A8K1CL86_PYTOL|nr:hypothetical protein Poli38472_007962 [Pythium oligandrum]|eukprot:TMW65320.1 hypothetical protein Poli38472_007962 [Pythium oligandrum]
MGQHFLFHRELVAATAVQHAVYAHLTNDYQHDLVVASPEYLRIYRVEPIPETHRGDIERGDDDAEPLALPKGQILHVVASFPLAGVVESMRVLHFDARLLRKKHRFHGGKDVLLLSFSLYKWVIVGYDRRTRGLSTLAMYSFSEDAVGPGATLKGERNGRDQLLGLSARPLAYVDPQTRCGAMLIYSDQLVIVPFRSSSMELSFFDEDDDEEEDEYGMEKSKSSSRGDGQHQNGANPAEDGEDDEDEEEKKLEELVKETKQRGMTSDMNKRLQNLLDKSVKIGVKRKRNHMSGLLSNELTGREFLLKLRELEISGKVIDMAFLDGYLEPTLMILHEENEKNSTDGRFAGGYDTYCLTVLSINLNTRLHPKIWSVKNLPSDCFRLIPCRTPVGGVVVLSANAILYFNQTLFYGLATNMFAEKTVNQTIFPLKEAMYETASGYPDKLNLLLENCEVEHLGKTEMLLAMPDGEMYVLTLPYQDTAHRGVHGFGGAAAEEVSLKLRHLGSGSTASCVCADDSRKTLFVGSRSGDSVLYSYVKRRDQSLENGHTNGTSTGDTDGVEGNGMETNGDDDHSVEEVDDEDDEDDIFLYGSSIRQLKASEDTTSNGTHNGSGQHHDSGNNGHYHYELLQLDVLPSIGQITSMEVGTERNADSNEHREQLVVGGGFLNSGSVSVVHSGLRPIVSTEAELSGCRAMWTVSSSLPTPESSPDGRPYNSYLILSVAQRTMVLRTGEGMEPLEEDSGFYTSGPTLAASNLFNQQRIVQVFKQGARVMMEVPVEDDPEAAKPERSNEEAAGDDEEEEEDDDDGPKVRLVCTQEITLEGDIESGGMNVDSSKVGIVSVDVIDPYILLLLTDGSIRVLMGDAEDLELTVIEPEVRYEDGNTEQIEGSAEFGACSACLFYDWAGMYRDGAWGEENVSEVTSEATPKKKQRHANDDEAQEEEELESLYSTRSSHQAKMLLELREGESHDGASASTRLLPQEEAPMMCGVCFADGSLHVYSLPDFKKKGIFPYLTFAPDILVNTMQHFQESKQKNVSHAAPALGINAMTGTANDGRIKKSHTVNSPVADIAIHRLGPSEGRLNSQYFSRMVLLVFLANGDLLMYAALPKIVASNSPTTSFQFVRITSDLITRPYLPPKAKAGSSHNEAGTNAEANTTAVLTKLRAGFRYPMLTRFLNVNNMSGVFFRGAHPMWVVAERGHPTFVPMSVNAVSPTVQAKPTVSVPVLSFTPFHHWNCPNGFIYFHSRGALRVCELPSSKTSTILPSSSGFVLHKIEFGATIHHMLYMGHHGPGGVAEALESPTYAIVCSRPMVPSVAEQATANEEEEEEQQPEEADSSLNTSNVMAPTAEMYPDLQVEDMVHTEEDVYELRLVQTNEFGEWERRGVFRVYFNRFEVVLSVKLMYLYDSSLLKDDVSSSSEEWNKKKKPYVVIGTGYVGPHGEDESGKGRLLLYELDYAQYATQSGESSAKLPKLRLMFIKEHHQGAISCVAQLGPYVVAAVGMKMIVYEYKSDQLIGCAFYDAQMYIVSISVVKDYVMYGDVYKSVHFLRWKEKQRQLQLLAKDYEPLAVTSTEFNLFERRLALLATDMEENLHVMQYAPQDIESRGGQRLLRTSDFHLGMQITSMFRKQVGVAPPPPRPAHQRQPVQQPSGQNVYVTVLGTSEGSVSAVIPVGERVFRRLFTLQNVMINTLPQNCALNPREFRMMKSNGRRRTGRPDAWSKQKWKKGFLDAHVLFRFLHLDYVAQKEIARCIGTTPEVIIHNLLEVQRATATFL